MFCGLCVLCLGRLPDALRAPRPCQPAVPGPILQWPGLAGRAAGAARPGPARPAVMCAQAPSSAPPAQGALDRSMAAQSPDAVYEEADALIAKLGAHVHPCTACVSGHSAVGRACTPRSLPLALAPAVAPQRPGLGCRRPVHQAAAAQAGGQLLARGVWRADQSGLHGVPHCLGPARPGA